MNAKPVLARRHLGVTVFAAAMAVIVALGLLTAVAALFQSDGAPLEQLVVAEHACADKAFVSEREFCMQLFIAASRLRNIASR